MRKLKLLSNQWPRLPFLALRAAVRVRLCPPEWAQTGNSNRSVSTVRISWKKSKKILQVRLYEEGYKARILVGYAWKWTSTKDGNPNGEVEDVIIPEYDFQMPWNGKALSAWAIDERGVDQIGCVHTSQGLEFDYVGVIIGNDLKFDPESMRVYADFDEYKDKQGKMGLRNNNELRNYIAGQLSRIVLLEAAQSKKLEA